MLKVFYVDKYSKNAQKGKVFYGQEPPVENELPLFVGSINYKLQYLYNHAIIQVALLSSSQLQPTTATANNGVGDGISVLLAVTSTLYKAVHPERHLHI